MGTGRHPWHQYADVAAMFKIAYSKDVPEIPECFSKEGKDFLSLCLKRDPAQRPSATQLLGHPFLQDHQELRASKCNINQLRNRPSFPIVVCQKKVIYVLVVFQTQFVHPPVIDICICLQFGYSPAKGLHRRESLLLFWTSKDKAREILQGFPLLILHPAKPPGTIIHIWKQCFHPPIATLCR
ncbi:hypothetical protein PR202_gb08784 [Eleusine coracana subsp. coracana]|uniref:Protein kinase domain-containing protein n=1 Tax=Eleusine coracana subsp. coracana TaxID=191504 RepID=A0AAV5EF25_ELECO|nr:hypothetical protein PR202_gb08784 [Eleusine coracana subsp. coracana]